MPQEIPLRLSLLGRHLSPVAQLIVVAAFILISGAGFLAWLAIGGTAGDRSEQAHPQRLAAAPGTFRPTNEQWAGFKIQPVQLVSFRPEQVTEGSIAIDDDLTTPVFSQHSGRVIKLIAKLGDHVEAGAPLFEIQATEFVQAQNDLITALANLQTERFFKPVMINT